MRGLEPRWLTADEIILINRREVGATGELFAVHDRGLLESAADRPRNRLAYDDEEDVVHLAIALMVGLAQNHPFAQGNKRTAHTAAVLFIRLNGYQWIAADTEATAEGLLAFIRGEVTETFLIELFRACVA